MVVYGFIFILGAICGSICTIYYTHILYKHAFTKYGEELNNQYLDSLIKFKQNFVQKYNQQNLSL